MSNSDGVLARPRSHWCLKTCAGTSQHRPFLARSPTWEPLVLSQRSASRLSRPTHLLLFFRFVPLTFALSISTATLTQHTAQLQALCYAELTGGPHKAFTRCSLLGDCRTRGSANERLDRSNHIPAQGGCRVTAWQARKHLLAKSGGIRDERRRE